MKSLEIVVASLVSCAALGALAGDADACYIPPPPYPMPGSEDVPANGIFSQDSTGWTMEDGSELEFAAEEEFANMLGHGSYSRLWRPARALTIGDVVTITNCFEGDSCAITIGDVDREAPGEPVLSDPYIYLGERAKRRILPGRYESFGYIGCSGPGMSHSEHTLELSLDVSDDRASFEDMWAVVYSAPDAARVNATTTGARLVWLNEAQSEPGRIWLDLFEDAEVLPTDQAFCVAVEVIDQAGNISPRSQPLCLDPTDRDAPYLDGPGAPGAGCGCATQEPTRIPPGMLLLGVFGLVGWSSRRRRRTTLDFARD